MYEIVGDLYSRCTCADLTVNSQSLSINSFYSAESLQHFLAFPEQSLFLFVGAHVQRVPDGTGRPHAGRARAKGAWTHGRRGCSSGQAQFSRGNLMEDP